MMLRFKPDLPRRRHDLCSGRALRRHRDRMRRHADRAAPAPSAACDSSGWYSPGMPCASAKRARLLRRCLGAGANVTVNVHNFRGSYFFPYCGADIKDAFEAMRSRVAPDLVMTHYLADRHQDHRVIAELTWNTFRSHAILEYEIPKYEGDLAHPGVYCPLSPATVDLEIATLLECFPSQRSHQWFDADLFRGHLRLRGIECNSPTRYAEAFHARKLVL